MLEIKQTATFQKWEHALKDRRAKVAIAARIFRLANGLAGDVPWVRGSVSCVFTMGRVIECTSGSRAKNSSSCCVVAIKAHKTGILKTRNNVQKSGGNDERTALQLRPGCRAG